MMKGYWHIVALSASIAVISVILGKNLFLFVFLWLVFLYLNQRLKIIPFLLSICSFLFFLVYLPAINLVADTSSEITSQNLILGKIIEYLAIQSNKIEFILEEMDSEEKIMVLYFPQNDEIKTEEASHIRYGGFCTVKGELELPQSARNPGEFDYREFLLTKGITKQVVVNDLTQIECEGASFWHRFFSLRIQLIRQAQENISDYSAAWVSALVLGDDSLIDDHVIKLFQDWGLSHILAISGLHIGIVVGIIYLLLIKSNVMTKEKSELIILFFLPAYAVLAGGEPSVLRACSMVLLLLVLRRLKINVSALDIISIVFIVLLLSNPYLIYHIGFQFSFIVTFGIILSRNWLSSVSSRTYQLLIISFISQMIILPIQFNYFSIFQPLSILVNLVIVPYFSLFVIPFMFFLLLFSFLPNSILQSFDAVFVGIHLRVIGVVEWIDEILYYPLYLSDLPVWFFVLYYLTLLTALFFVEKGCLKEALTGFISVSLLIIGYAAIPYFSDDGSVTMLDIGQGDAFIIELPYRKGVFMIDAGAKFSFEDMQPSPSVYQRIIKPYLRANGIHHIDALFLTHEDIDHMGSVEFMLDAGIVGAVYVSDYFDISTSLLNKMEDNNIPIYRLTAGELITIGDQSFTVLGPSKDKRKSNENSLVLHAEIGGKSWLFTGDISKTEELEIINDYRLNADIIKIAHHGSDTSSDPLFLESLQSEVAFIPVGENNAYGHPSSEVIHRLEELGVRVFRTDQHGAVKYNFSNKDGYFQTFLGN